MRYTGLFEDFENVRTTQPYILGKIVDEAQNYIQYLEGKEDTLNEVVAYLNELDASTKTEKKAEILAQLVTLIPGK
jgi:hypothetical protein